jgi:gamma-glutamyl:cysteine ligase YbdK (ATP-grasp superfamily)
MSEPDTGGVEREIRERLEEYPNDDECVCASCEDSRLLRSALDALTRRDEQFAEAQGEIERLREALSEAANRINCAGPVAHRIDVLRQTLSDQLRAAESESASLRARVTELEGALRTSYVLEDQRTTCVDSPDDRHGYECVLCGHRLSAAHAPLLVPKQGE